jgi:hypothetical protein
MAVSILNLSPFLRKCRRVPEILIFVHFTYNPVLLVITRQFPSKNSDTTTTQLILSIFLNISPRA